MKHISRTGNKPSKLGIVAVGAAQIVDGLVSVLSFGHFTSSFTFSLLAYTMKIELRKHKE